MRKQYTTQEIEKSHRQTRTKIDRRRRNTEDVIVQRVVEITKISKHAFKNGQMNATDVLPRAISCTNDEWNAQFTAIEISAARMKADTERAWGALGSMILLS